ncbi:MAG: hypothetical protein KDA51_10860 [Planctomycetales bacterium]|nr:hypothetical protein [Planctomycetales bacterium]
MTADEMSRRLGMIWADAAGDGHDAEFIEETISVLVMASLAHGVAGYHDYADDDTDAIEDAIARKVNDLLLTEVAKVNGT